MEPGTKKKLLIAIPILIIASVGGYLYWKHKKDEEEQSLLAKQQDIVPASGANIGASDTKIVTNRPVGISKSGNKPTVSASTSPSAKPLSSAAPSRMDMHTFLAGGGNINQRKIYGKFNGGTLYSAAAGNPKFGVTKQGELLGTAYKAVLTGTGDYLVYFTNPNGVPLFVSDRFSTI